MMTEHKLSSGLPYTMQGQVKDVKTGHYNAMPDGLREITKDEFTSGFMTWCLEAVERRQVTNDPKNKSYNLAMFHFNNAVGYAFSDNYSVIGSRFFRFGCEHDYQAMTKDQLAAHKIKLFRCTHASICAKCGHIMVVDSSD